MVDLDPLLGRHFQGEVDRETVGVVQCECRVPREPRAASALNVGHRDVEDRGPGAKGLKERGLLALADAANTSCTRNELGVLRAHREHRGIDELAHGLVGPSEDAHVADHASHDPAKDVAPSFVTRQDAVGDKEGAGARVVGHDAKANVTLVIRTVPGFGECTGSVEDDPRGVDFVDVLDTLQ
ncbi:unannotated protein [freshwater metagenome]|uniref:Unannotated protein n=1 Tax=freshwater metagenome TaxID=449393 RepID=A0A6J7C6Q0_9ZZZZ